MLATKGYSQDQKITSDTLRKLDKFLNEAIERYDYSTAIDYSAHLIDLASKEKDVKYLYRGYRILGITYQNLNDLERARENYEKALEYALHTDNDTILMGAYNNLGNVFSENKETVEKGLDYYDKALSYGNNIQNFSGILTPILNKGWTHLDHEQYERALPYLQEAKILLKNEENLIANSQLMTLFGKYYSGIGEKEKARMFFENSLRQAERDSLVIEASFASKEYGKMLYKIGDYKKAYEVNNVHQEYQAKIFEAEKLNQMEAAYARFGMEESKKELELAEKEQEYQDNVIEKTQQLSLILILFIFILIIVLLLLVRKRRELIAAKEEAERLSLLKTKFFSTVSHELRTPLYGVVGLTSLLLENNSDESQKEDLNSLKFSADYLLALINDVLQMNKMESNLVHLEDIPFNIRDLLHSIVKSFEFSRKQNKNSIDLEISNEVPEVIIGDSVRLSQVIMNLAGNSVKFTERGKVWIRVEVREDKGDTCLIHFEIGDTGIGIPKSKQEEIFEEFSQLKPSNFSYQGTGLGLPIVKRLLHLFNSEINLQSEVGLGSVFSFQIGFRKGKPMKRNHIREEDFPELEGRRVLIVDDNRINLVVTQRVLEKRNFQCKVATGGYEAIEILQNQEFDLILMDVNMPDIDGMETTRKIREFNKKVPVIALTAVELDEMIEIILNSGMNDIIVKPYDINQFFNTIYKNLKASEHFVV